MILDEPEGMQTRAELADILATLFERVSPRAEVVARAEAAAAGKIDAKLWGKLNDEVGVMALTVPEEMGGSGATIAETAVVLELLGRRSAALPFLGSFLAVEALVRAAEPAARDQWLGALAAGETVGAVSWSEGLTAEESPSGWKVSGTVDLVIDGQSAGLLLAPVSTSAGPRWFAVDLSACIRQRRETLDLTRDLTLLSLLDSEGTPLTDSEDSTLGRCLQDVATLALAVEQLGVAEQALEDAVEYATVREQFGRTIGSFQAIKHLLADVATEADLARSLVEHAIWAAAEHPDELTEAAAMAMLGASRAAVFASAENVQVHGGIGFSWEHPAHLHFRKARSNEVLLGSRAEYAERILTAAGASS